MLDGVQCQGTWPFTVNSTRLCRSFVVAKKRRSGRKDAGIAWSRATGYVALANKKLQGSERIICLEARTMLFGLVGPNVACVQVPAVNYLAFGLFF